MSTPRLPSDMRHVLDEWLEAHPNLDDAGMEGETRGHLTVQIFKKKELLDEATFPIERRDAARALVLALKRSRRDRRGKSSALSR